ncbi:hypothetical protein LCGC14_1108240 [marine sediment metagenome]|uniref:Uncharacterized protein n=1 Tax=marine sediment metagenome TaxID=412755 RepID=A0A0F9PQP1_9ZZZZ
MAGRPKKSFSIEEVAVLEQLAFEGCQTGTIANITGIAYNTLTRHFGKNLTKKRCERKQWLRQCQNSQAQTSADMCKFLGKNELGQVDKQIITTKDVPIAVPEAEKEAMDAACKVYKLKLAGSA